VTAASSVEASATSMKASAKTRLPARRESSGHSSMIETAEGSGMSAGLGMWRRKAVPRWREASAAGKATTMKSTGAIEVVAIDEHPAVRYVGVVVVNDAVVMPIVAPVVPTPAKSTKETDSKAEAKSNSRTGKE
jgi:hypothetical protein